MSARRILIPSLCISLWAAAGAADWPFYLGANRDNTSADKNLKLWSGDSPKVLWKKNVGAGHSSMTVAGKQDLHTGRRRCLVPGYRNGRRRLALPAHGARR